MVAGSARLADGTLAGSTLSLDAALRNLMASTGCTLALALSAITKAPAAVLELSSTRGQIAPGCVADLVLLTPRLHVHSTIVKGKIVYEKGTNSTCSTLALG